MAVPAAVSRGRGGQRGAGADPAPAAALLLAAPALLSVRGSSGELVLDGVPVSPSITIREVRQLCAAKTRAEDRTRSPSNEVPTSFPAKFLLDEAFVLVDSRPDAESFANQLNTKQLLDEPGGAAKYTSTFAEELLVLIRSEQVNCGDNIDYLFSVVVNGVSHTFLSETTRRAAAAGEAAVVGGGAPDPQAAPAREEVVKSVGCRFVVDRILSRYGVARPAQEEIMAKIPVSELDKMLDCYGRQGTSMEGRGQLSMTEVADEKLLRDVELEVLWLKGTGDYHDWTFECIIRSRDLFYHSGFRIQCPSNKVRRKRIRAFEKSWSGLRALVPLVPCPEFEDEVKWARAEFGYKHTGGKHQDVAIWVYDETRVGFVDAVVAGVKAYARNWASPGYQKTVIVFVANKCGGSSGSGGGGVDRSTEGFSARQLHQLEELYSVFGDFLLRLAVPVWKEGAFPDEADLFTKRMREGSVWLRNSKNIQTLQEAFDSVWRKIKSGEFVEERPAGERKVSAMVPPLPPGGGTIAEILNPFVQDALGGTDFEAAGEAAVGRSVARLGEPQWPLLHARLSYCAAYDTSLKEEGVVENNERDVDPSASVARLNKELLQLDRVFLAACREAQARHDVRLRRFAAAPRCSSAAPSDPAGPQHDDEPDNPIGAHVGELPAERLAVLRGQPPPQIPRAEMARTVHGRHSTELSLDTEALRLGNFLGATVEGVNGRLRYNPDGVPQNVGEFPNPAVGADGRLLRRGAGVGGKKECLVM